MSNIVLGGYEWSDIQDMAHILINAGAVSYRVKENGRWVNKKRIPNENEARTIAAQAARYGCHPLNMTCFETKGELVISPPMDMLYSWEHSNGGLFRLWLEEEDGFKIEYGKQVKVLVQKVWGIHRIFLPQYQQMFRENLALYDGVFDKMEAVKAAKLETFQMLGTMGEGSAKVTELGNVQGRSNEFTLKKRADADLIVKAFGRPSPADVAAKMNRAEDYAQLPNNWTVEQKQIGAGIQSGHREFSALPSPQQREQRNRNVNLLRGDSDPNDIDPYEEAPQITLRDKLAELNSLVDGYFKHPKHMTNALGIDEWPNLQDNEGWQGVIAQAVAHVASKEQPQTDEQPAPRSLEHFQAELAMRGGTEEEHNQLLQTFHQDPDTAWEMLT